MPDTKRFLQGSFAPVTEEVTALGLPVTGRLPARIPLGFHGNWIPGR
jgi:carotenoid cleavage dioxygenase